MKNILRRLRGALGNALVWGTIWFATGFILMSGVYLFTLNDPSYHWIVYLRSALRFATSAAATGAVTGGVFSAYIAAAFRNKRIQDLSSGRAALGGGLISVLLVLVFLIVVNADSGFPLRLEDVIPAILTYGTIGGVTGFGSIKLAQRALPGGNAPGELEVESMPLLPES